MILSSEFSRRRIRSVNKLIRVGREEVVVVLRVDKEKGESNFQLDFDFDFELELDFLINILAAGINLNDRLH